MSFLFYTEELTDAIAELIDDEQVQDIMNYGCASCAPSGLVYYHETNKFFDDHEDSVEDVCYDILGNAWIQELASGRDFICSIGELKNKAVWFTVEQYACAKFSYLEDMALVAA